MLLSLFDWCEKALDRATPDGAMGGMKAADVLADACNQHIEHVQDW